MRLVPLALPILIVAACSSSSRAPAAVRSGSDGGASSGEGPTDSGTPGEMATPTATTAPSSVPTAAADAGAAGPADGGEAPQDAGSSSGCSAGASPRTGDFHLQATDSKGNARDYEVIVPSPIAPTTPLALTFVYHGAGGTESIAEGFNLQTAPGAAKASIFVFPQGIAYQNDGVGWDDSCGGYDMAFFDSMLSHLEASYCINKATVFAAGFSWGCDFVTALACCRGDRIRAMGAASCSDDFANTAKASTYVNLPCPASGHTGIRFTFDPNGDNGYTAQDFKTTLALYESFNSCSTGTTPTSVSACVSVDGCSNPLLECTYPGLGHALPSSWPADTWNFFSTFK